jgi:hypothetical protein
MWFGDFVRFFVVFFFSFVFCGFWTKTRFLWVGRRVETRHKACHGFSTFLRGRNRISAGNILCRGVFFVQEKCSRLVLEILFSFQKAGNLEPIARFGGRGGSPTGRMLLEGQEDPSAGPIGGI